MTNTQALEALRDKVAAERRDPKTLISAESYGRDCGLKIALAAIDEAIAQSKEAGND